MLCSPPLLPIELPPGASGKRRPPYSCDMCKARTCVTCVRLWSKGGPITTAFCDGHAQNLCHSAPSRGGTRECGSIPREPRSISTDKGKHDQLACPAESPPVEVRGGLRHIHGLFTVYPIPAAVVQLHLRGNVVGRASSSQNMRNTLLGPCRVTGDENRHIRATLKVLMLVNAACCNPRRAITEGRVCTPSFRSTANVRTCMPTSKRGADCTSSSL